MLTATLTQVCQYPPRYIVGVKGTAPSGLKVDRPHFLTRGPWCKTTARQHAANLQADLDAGRVGWLLGWQKSAPAA
jgi:hypothetical protein